LYIKVDGSKLRLLSLINWVAIVQKEEEGGGGHRKEKKGGGHPGRAGITPLYLYHHTSAYINAL
jgi:hypothetical protein